MWEGRGGGRKGKAELELAGTNYFVFSSSSAMSPHDQKVHEFTKYVIVTSDCSSNGYFTLQYSKVEESLVSHISDIRIEKGIERLSLCVSTVGREQQEG